MASGSEAEARRSAPVTARPLRGDPRVRMARPRPIRSPCVARVGRPCQPDLALDPSRRPRSRMPAGRCRASGAPSPRTARAGSSIRIGATDAGWHDLVWAPACERQPRVPRASVRSVFLGWSRSRRTVARDLDPVSPRSDRHRRAESAPQASARMRRPTPASSPGRVQRPLSRSSGLQVSAASARYPAGISTHGRRARWQGGGAQCVRGGRGGRRTFRAGRSGTQAQRSVKARSRALMIGFRR